MSREIVSDPVPHNGNRLGYWLGFVFHPFAVFIPALLVVLRDADPVEIAGWVAFIAVIILIPAVILIQIARQRGQYTYQRGMRRPLYLVFWVSMIFCTSLAATLDAPERLVFSLLALCVWVPLQAVINARLTKISAHTAVVTGILTALFVLGDLSSLPLVVGAVGIVLVTAWARVVTGHHTIWQVSLGAVISMLSVITAFGVIVFLKN